MRKPFLSHRGQQTFEVSGNCFWKISCRIFGFIWGIVGMFLAVPLLSVLQIICANVENTRPSAMLISSGRSYKKQVRERPDRRRAQKRNGKNPKNSGYDGFSDDIMFPDRK